MFRLRAAAGALLVLMLLVGLQASALAQGGRIAGRVLDAETGDPIVGADISLQAPDAPLRTLRTDADGRFSLDGLSSGPWQVHVRAEGYNDDLGNLDVADEPGPPLEFRLVRVRRAVVEALGEPAADALDLEQIEVQLAAADAAFNREDWDGAIAAYSSVLDKLPELVHLGSPLGRAYRARGDYQPALRAFEMALAAAPGNEAVHADIARTELAVADFAAAQRELAAEASGSEARREDFYNLGELEFAQGAVDAAAAWYEKAAVVDPGWAKPVFKLGLVALNRGDFDLAKAHFRRVVELDPASDEGAQASATLAVLP